MDNFTIIFTCEKCNKVTKNTKDVHIMGSCKDPQKNNKSTLISYYIVCKECIALCGCNKCKCEGCSNTYKDCTCCKDCHRSQINCTCCKKCLKIRRNCICKKTIKIF